MSEERFSSGLTSFVAEHISSVVALEVLLLLRASRARSWNAQALAAELRIDRHFAEAQLDALARGGLLARSGEDGTYRYAPSSAERDGVVGELEAQYAQRRVSIVTLIYAAPAERARAFADAFRVRKEPEDG
jgi:hypothetical protein